MGTRTITLPSGLSGEVRNMKARELAYLADPNNGRAVGKGKKSKKSHPLDPIFKGCWLNTTDAGPYGAVGEPLNWGKVVVADRFTALIHIRDLTWGDFEFRVRCPTVTCPRHKKSFVWGIALGELDVKPLPPESIEKIKNKDLIFPVSIAEKACTFKLMTGDDEANAPELSDDLPTYRKLLAQVGARLVSIEGLPADHEDDKVLDWVGDLDLPELYAASKVMDAIDGGIETRTIVECPDCGVEFAHDIPFGDPAFLTPIPK
jgi:hypothetical protein